MGILNEVIGWTPDSKNVIFLSRRDASNGWIKRPFTVERERRAAAAHAHG